MSMTQNIISDICRSKYGNAIDTAVRNLDVRDVEEIIEVIAWGEADALYKDDRRYQDVDHAYHDMSRNQAVYGRLVGFSAMVILGMGLDILPWFQGEFDRELPRQLQADADQAYRSVLRDTAIESRNEPIASGYRAGSDNHQQVNPRLGNSLNKGKYNTPSSSKTDFTDRARESANAPRYSGNAGGFAERARGEERAYEPVAHTDHEVRDRHSSTVPVETPNVIYRTPTQLNAFNATTGVLMEAYEAHEIVAIKERHVGMPLKVSKLVTLNPSAGGNLDITWGESERDVKLDVPPSNMLQVPMHTSVANQITSHTATAEHGYTMLTSVADSYIEMFDNKSINGILNTLDNYINVFRRGDEHSELMSYMVTIISRYVSQGLTLGLGEIVSIRPNELVWSLSVGELELTFPSIADGVSQLMEAKAYNWAAQSIEEIFSNSYMRNRFDIACDGSELDDAQDSLKFIVKQGRTIINAPGHLDTNVSHIDNGSIVEVNKDNNHVFAAALRCIEMHIKTDGNRYGSVILIDDYGYALEFITAFGGHKLYVQRHMTY